MSWNPTDNLSLQASWADITSPEALEPDVDEDALVGQRHLHRPLGGDGWWSATLAFSNKESSEGVSLDAWLGEAALHPNERWTFFARAEAIESNELAAVHGQVEPVQRLSLGAIRDWRIMRTCVAGRWGPGTAALRRPMRLSQAMAAMLTGRWGLCG